MISPKLYEKYAKDPAAFRADLIVDVDGAAKRFGDVQDDWQKTDFSVIDPALKRCNGRSASKADVRNRAYLERGRGHSKTSDLAMIATWALVFATRPIRGFCFASDEEQAGLLKDAVSTLVHLNPWLGGILEVQKGLVVNIALDHPGKGSKLKIFTSDVGSSYGILADFIIGDEFSVWEPGAERLWHSLISSAGKRDNCLMVVITNAGYGGTWQWTARELIRTDPDWYFSRLDGPVASWMTPKRLAEQRRHLPAAAFARLFLNVWAATGGDALTPEDIASAFFSDLLPMSGSEPNVQFVGGCDLGLTRDSSCFVILAVPEGGFAGRIRLAHHKRWNPTPGRKIEIADIERHILAMDAQYNLQLVGLDQWQAEHLAQRLEASTEHKRRNAIKLRFATEPWVRAIAPTGAVLRQQASLMVEMFSDRRILLHPCEPLRADLLKLRAEEKSYGIRFTSPRDETGHGDSASAFMMALMIASEIGIRKTVGAGAVDENGQLFADESRMSLSEIMANRFEARQLNYQVEMEMLSQPEDHQDLFRQAMEKHRNPYQ